jgi:hypothetical protein
MDRKTIFSPILSIVVVSLLLITLACTCNIASLLPPPGTVNHSATAFFSDQWIITIIPTAWAPRYVEIIDNVIFTGGANGGIVDQTGRGTSIGNYTLVGPQVKIALTALHENCRTDLIGRFVTPTKMEGTYTSDCYTKNLLTGAWTATTSK